MKGRLEVKQHYIEAYDSYLLTSGRRLEDDHGKKPARFSKVPLTFRARNQIFKSK